VAKVLNWILQNFSFDELPGDFVPYSEEEVARFRRKPMADVSAVRAALRAKITE